GGNPPRSTTVTGHSLSSDRSTPELSGRYELTCPVESASAIAAPGPTAVAHEPVSAIRSPSRPIWALYEFSSCCCCRARQPGTTTPPPSVAVGSGGRREDR